MNLITNFGKKVAQIAIDFISGFIFSIFFFLFPGVILSMQPNYKKSYNSIIVACFMFSLFLNLLLSENFRSLKANLLSAGFILIILYVLALKKSKELLPETDLKLRELVSKLISCLNIDVPIGVIIIIGLFNYYLVYYFAHFFAYFVAVIIIVIIIIITLIYILKKSSLLIFLEAVAPIIYFFQLFIIFPIFLYDSIKLKLTKIINGITVIKPILQIIIVDKPILLLIPLLVSFIVVSSVNYFIVCIVYKLNIEDKLNKLFKK